MDGLPPHQVHLGARPQFLESEGFEGENPGVRQHVPQHDESSEAGSSRIRVKTKVEKKNKEESERKAKTSQIEGIEKAKEERKKTIKKTKGGQKKNKSVVLFCESSARIFVEFKD